MKLSRCNIGDRFVGLGGWASTSYIGSLSSRCASASGVYSGPSIGIWSNGRTYYSVRCSSTDRALGIHGTEDPYPRGIGLICQP